MGHGFRAHARLVGKGGPPDAGHDDGAEDAARSRLPGEGIGKDQAKRIGNARKVVAQDNQGAEAVENDHAGHKPSRDHTDALDAAEDDGADQAGKEQPEEAVAEVDHFLGVREPVVRLEEHVANDLGQLVRLQQGKTTEHSAKAKHDGQGLPLAAQALDDEIHGATLHLPRVVPAPIHHGEAAGEELGGHAEESADPHPEYGAGSTLGHRDCNPCDVAHPDGSGKGAAQGPEVADLAGGPLVVELAQEGLNSMPEKEEGKKPGVN